MAALGPARRRKTSKIARPAPARRVTRKVAHPALARRSSKRSATWGSGSSRKKKK